MKLLSPQEIKDLREQNITRDLLRANEAEEVAKKSRLNLAASEADFYKSLAAQKDRWAEEEREHRERKNQMKSDIDELEAKKINALIPVGILKNGVYDRMDDAVAFLAKLRKRENDIEELTEKLEDKLDETGEREINVKKEETRQLLVQQGINRQIESTKQGTEKLTNALTEFTVKCQNIEKELNDRKTAIFLQERTLETKEIKLKRTEKLLSDWDRKLHDERETLDRAFKEVQRMKENLNKK